MANIFLSYSREDRVEAARLAEALETSRWTVWWDRSLIPGEAYERVIANELQAAQCVIVLWSNSSINSDWVRDEANDAKARDVLVPALIADVKPPLGFRQLETVNLAGWVGASADPEFHSLCDGVRRHVKAPRTDDRTTSTPASPHSGRGLQRALPASLSALAGLVFVSTVILSVATALWLKKYTVVPLQPSEYSVIVLGWMIVLVITVWAVRRVRQWL